MTPICHILNIKKNLFQGAFLKPVKETGFSSKHSFTKIKFEFMFYFMGANTSFERKNAKSL
jgi:hypothetical protein